jgi:hypothetical protein
MTATALLTCCCDGCSLCGVTAWTVQGFGGTITWVSDCDTAASPPLLLGSTGTIGYAVPSSVVVPFDVQSLPNVCSWQTTTAWVDGGSIVDCEDCGTDPQTQITQRFFRFRTEVQIVLSWTGGALIARCYVTIFGQTSTNLDPTTWTAVGTCGGFGAGNPTCVASAEYGTTWNPHTGCPPVQPWPLIDSCLPSTTSVSLPATVCSSYFGVSSGPVFDGAYSWASSVNVT